MAFFSCPFPPSFPPNKEEEREGNRQSCHQHDRHTKTRYNGLGSAVVTARHRFSALPGDVLLAALPNAGAGWVKSLAFAVLNRHDPTALSSFDPRRCVPVLEDYRVPAGDAAAPPAPRLLATRLPCSRLPPSVAGSDHCKIVYVCRNPRDTFSSLWHLVNKIIPMDGDAFECHLVDGVHLAGRGPCSDHVLGYWKASRASPRKVLFLRYEELKRESSGELRRLAEFMGRPFSKEEVKEGVVEKMLEMCGSVKRRSLPFRKVNQTKGTKT